MAFCACSSLIILPSSFGSISPEASRRQPASRDSTPRRYSRSLVIDGTVIGSGGAVVDGREGAPDFGGTTVNSLRGTPVLVPSTNAHSFPSRRWALCTRLGVSNWSTPPLVHCTRSPASTLFGSIEALLNSGSMRSSGSLTGLAIPTLHECPPFRLVDPCNRFAAWHAQRSNIGPPRRRRRPHAEVHDAEACTPPGPARAAPAAD